MKKYQVSYRVIVNRTKVVEANSIALAQEKLEDTEHDYIEDVMAIEELKLK